MYLSFSQSTLGFRDGQVEGWSRSGADFEELAHDALKLTKQFE
jgi:hypothetical protein